MGGEEITEEIAREAMRLAQYKLPIKTKFLTVGDQENTSSNSHIASSTEPQLSES